jgi:hypothetical protein
MNYGKLVDALADEGRNLLKRIEFAEAREEKLAELARSIEETEETPESVELLDRVSDLVNWQIRKVGDLKWRQQEIRRAAYMIEEVNDMRSNRARRNRKSSRAARQAREA